MLIMNTVNAPMAQWTRHGATDSGIQIRFLVGAPICTSGSIVEWRFAKAQTPEHNRSGVPT